MKGTLERILNCITGITEKMFGYFTKGQEVNGVGKQQKTTLMLILLGLIGVILILAGNSFSQNNQLSEKKPPNSVAVLGSVKNEPTERISHGNGFSEKRFELETKSILGKIKGAGEVFVDITLDSDVEKVYAQNKSRNSQTTEENDKSGGRRTITEAKDDEQVVVVRNGQKEEPVIVSKKMPKIKGVLVVASGAGNSEVKFMLEQAVQTLFELPSHRVSVQAM